MWLIPLEDYLWVADNSVWSLINKGDEQTRDEYHTQSVVQTYLLFSERELTFTFAICCRPSVCRL